jgi:hypothetical protein
MISCRYPQRQRCPFTDVELIMPLERPLTGDQGDEHPPDRFVSAGVCRRCPRPPLLRALPFPTIPCSLALETTLDELVKYLVEVPGEGADEKRLHK